MRSHNMLLAAFAATILTAVAVTAATIPVNCQVTKHKQAGMLAKCLHTAESKFAVVGDLVARNAAVVKCIDAFAEKWAAAEDKAESSGQACQTSEDADAVWTSVYANTRCVAIALDTGDTTCLRCGNGVLDSGEECDFGTVGGATCQSATGGTRPNGTLICGPGCVLDTRECSAED